MVGNKDATQLSIEETVKITNMSQLLNPMGTLTTTMMKQAIFHSVAFHTINISCTVLKNSPNAVTQNSSC